MRKQFLLLAIGIMGNVARVNAADFSRCHLMAPGIQVPYGIGADGKLDRPKRDANLVTYSNLDGEEKAVVKATSHFVDYKQITYSIHSDHGKPLSYAVEAGDMKSDFTFGYDGDKCFVAEASNRGPDPISHKKMTEVSYSKDMCDQVNSFAEKMSADKLQECGSVFSSVDFIRNQYQNKFAAQGRSLGSPMPGVFFPSKPANAPVGVPSTMDVIMGCRGARYFYPVDGIKSASLSSYGGYMGGFIGNEAAPNKGTQPAQ